jgi:hypothetical protein
MPELTRAELQHEWEEFARKEVATELGHYKRNAQTVFAATEDRIDELEKKLERIIMGDGNGNKGLLRRLDSAEQRITTAEDRVARSEADVNRRQAEIISLLKTPNTAPAPALPPERSDGKTLRFDMLTMRNVGIAAALIAYGFVNTWVVRSMGETDEQDAVTRRMQEALTRLEESARYQDQTLQGVAPRQLPAKAINPEPVPSE